MNCMRYNKAIGFVLLMSLATLGMPGAQAEPMAAILAAMKTVDEEIADGNAEWEEISAAANGIQVPVNSGLETDDGMWAKPIVLLDIEMEMQGGKAVLGSKNPLLASYNAQEPKWAADSEAYYQAKGKFMDASNEIARITLKIESEEKDLESAMASGNEKFQDQIRSNLSKLNQDKMNKESERASAESQMQSARIKVDANNAARSNLDRQANEGYSRYIKKNQP